jgi:hypothetical protein
MGSSPRSWVSLGVRGFLPERGKSTPHCGNVKVDYAASRQSRDQSIAARRLNAR